MATTKKPTKSTTASKARTGTRKSTSKTAARSTGGTRARASSSKSNSTPIVRGNTNLVIVESPAKARTIGKYLGRGFSVEASMGHVRDLPKSTLGVDTEHNFNPQYVVP